MAVWMEIENRVSFVKLGDVNLFADAGLRSSHGQKSRPLTNPLSWSLSTAVNGLSCIARLWPRGRRKVEGWAIKDGS